MFITHVYSHYLKVTAIALFPTLPLNDMHALSFLRMNMHMAIQRYPDETIDGHGMMGACQAGRVGGKLGPYPTTPFLPRQSKINSNSAKVIACTHVQMLCQLRLLSVPFPTACKTCSVHEHPSNFEVCFHVLT